MELLISPKPFASGVYSLSFKFQYGATNMKHEKSYYRVQI